MLLWPAECITNSWASFMQLLWTACMQLAIQSVVVNLWQQAGWQSYFH